MNLTERRGLDWIHAGHLVLAGLMALWRLLESTPGIASASGGAFSASQFGRTLALVSILAGIAALVTVVFHSFRARRNWRVIVLLVSLAGALAFRRDVDVFDVTYWMLVAIFATLWFGGQRRTAAP